MVNYLSKFIRICLLAVLSAALALTLMPAHKVHADQANPDSTPVANIYVFRNILETGDMGVFIYANIPYAATPANTVSEAFYWRLIDTDNTTELGVTTGYAYNASGYGYNAFWMYFAAASAPAWAGAYTVRLSGNPSIFVSPPTYNYPIVSSDYSSLTAQSDVQSAIANRILQTATDMDIQWGLSSTTSLLLELETGTVLSIYGEAVFRNIIYGCQAIAPAVFRFNISAITATNRTFGSGYSSNVTNQWSGAWVATAQQGGGDFFGKSYDLMSIMILFAICVGLLVLQTKFSNNFWSAFIDIAVVLIVAARLSIGLGSNGMAFMGLMAALFWTYDCAKAMGLIGR